MVQFIIIIIIVIVIIIIIIITIIIIIFLFFDRIIYKLIVIEIQSSYLVREFEKFRL